MHGRLKVKTSEEQAESRRKEQQKKLEIYKAAVSRIFDKRTRTELDDELLSLTGQVLSKNPDFYTLWNIRRELITHWINTRPKEEVDKLLRDELGFLEHCITVNPKSYGSWHQRGWVVGMMVAPDWRKEIQLCTRFLQVDERNFHCWDYRRFAVKKAGVAAEEEFKFTTEKISDNFSNFSSWHYRSKLLPLVYPASRCEMSTSLGGGEGGGIQEGAAVNFTGEQSTDENVNISNISIQQGESSNPASDAGDVAADSASAAEDTVAASADSTAAAAINSDGAMNSSSERVLFDMDSINHSTQVRQDILTQELELVENAYFTDPNDQSAWFYHRWLLGRVVKEQRINFVSINSSDGRIIVSLERPARISRTHDIELLIGGEPMLNLAWFAPSGSHCDHIWTAVFKDKENLQNSSAVEICVRLYCRTSRNQTSGSLCDEVQLRVEPATSGSEVKCAQWMRKHGTVGSLFSRDLGAATTSTLEKQLGSCLQLHELEPDNKWVLLTLLSLMRAVDPVSHLGDTLDYLDKLISVDPMRLTYYLDLRSRFIMENKIEEWLDRSDSMLKFTLTSARLTSAYHLTRLCAAQYINLSHNSLHRLSGAQALQCVRTLNLSHNKVRTLHGIGHLPYLRELDLSHNELEDLAEILSLGSCTSLAVLNLEGNVVLDKIKATNTETEDKLLRQIISLLSSL